jgi:hypothetical protein
VIVDRGHAVDVPPVLIGGTARDPER